MPRGANDPRTGLSYSQLRQCAIPCARAAGPAPPAPGVDGRYFCKESGSASSYYDRCDAEGGCVAPPKLKAALETKAKPESKELVPRDR